MISTFFWAGRRSRPNTTEPDLSSFASDFTQLGSTDFSTLSTVAPLVSSFPIVPGAGDSGFSTGPGAGNLSGLMTSSAGLAGSVATGMSTVTNSAAQSTAQPFPQETITYPGSGLVFVNTYSANVTAAYRTAIIAAENFFQGQFTNSVTLNVNFDFSPLSNGPDGAAAMVSFRPMTNVSYSTLKAALQSHATTPTAMLAANSLPSTDPSNGVGFAVPVGMAKILELPGAASFTDTPDVTLNSNLSWTFGQDAIGAVEHEISEGAMGRIGSLGIALPPFFEPMDLFRYSAPGQHDYTGGRDGLPTYFSVNGTNLITQLPFHNSVNTAGVFDGLDFADWDASGDAFGFGGPGNPGTVSPTDLNVMRVLGWTSGNFTVTTNITQQNNGDPYTGPVAGVQFQYINKSAGPLAVTANVANSFIATGSGNDAIDVSQVGGINVLDGGTSSNFLTGGTGVGSKDTFFVDDRNAPGAIWSTVVNFHVGDSATVWGITPTGFTQNSLANQGAPGFTGLTLQFMAAGLPTASLTLAGYGLADLTNGRLTTSFGTTADGAPYFSVHANA